MSIGVPPHDNSKEARQENRQENRQEKKPGPREPGLRYWPREADTITFQEGLLNRHVTGGGGHMRNATAQRLSTMILICAVQQPPRQHV